VQGSITPAVTRTAISAINGLFGIARVCLSKVFGQDVFNTFKLLIHAKQKLSSILSNDFGY
jgi:hypothetical protein